jgi:hypothetical protein
MCVLHNVHLSLKIIQISRLYDLYLAFFLLWTSLRLLLLADLLLTASSAVPCVPFVLAAAGVPALAETLAVSNVLYVPE